MLTGFIFKFFLIFYSLSSFFNAQNSFENPILKRGKLSSPLVETSSFVFNNKSYLLKNNQQLCDVQWTKPGGYFPEYEVIVWDNESVKLISVSLKNHGFGTALTWKGFVYDSTDKYGKEKPLGPMTAITVTNSKDLKHSIKPLTLYKVSGKKLLFNTAIYKGENEFILLYETYAPHCKIFPLQYLKSTDLIRCKKIHFNDN